MFKKILIANRGEIAVRILGACRELNIATVAVYSEADRRALHVRLADEAMYIGPAPASESYLSIDNLLAAARATGAQAIHPGYGFLSENDAFALAVHQAGMVFIGPPASAIQTMGDKALARKQVQGAGVPVVPGYQGPDSLEELAAAAQEIGYPVLVKAAAGGGGKGMRLAQEPSDLRDSVEASRREAKHAFGDEHLILEKYIPKARHIEFQILADQHGSCLHLLERECSIQRRHQKIIEETPSLELDLRLRNEMGKAAVAAAQAVGYQNAGTIEFIFDPVQRTYYFLEMNTRLQVEHAVTELITGLDLVQWQILIAAGERLNLSQDQVQAIGHAIECRLYAEDPANNFLPATGPLLRWIEPQGPGIRVDSGFSSGDEIGIHYDPLIAKLIVHAENREAAIRKMQFALRQTVILGITTNWQFLQDILVHPAFLEGRVYTTWVEEVFEDWQPPQCDMPPAVLAAAALTQFSLASTEAQRKNTFSQSRVQDAFSPWRVSNRFRISE